MPSPIYFHSSTIINSQSFDHFRWWCILDFRLSPLAKMYNTFVATLPMHLLISAIHLLHVPLSIHITTQEIGHGLSYNHTHSRSARYQSAVCNNVIVCYSSDLSSHLSQVLSYGISKSVSHCLMYSGL